MTTSFANTHFTGSAFLTVTPSKQCIAYLFFSEVQLLLFGWFRLLVTEKVVRLEERISE